MKFEITYHWFNLNAAPRDEEEVDDCVVGPQARNIKTVIIDTEELRGYEDAKTPDDISDIFIKKIVAKLPPNTVARVCVCKEI